MFLFLLLAAGTVLLIGKADPQLFERARNAVTDAFAPVLGAVSRPIATGTAHGRAHIAAQRRGISLNTLISEALNRDID